MRATSVSILAILCVPAIVLAEKVTFDIAAFHVPPGWERVPSPGMLSLRAPQGRGGSAQIFLFPSRASTGNPVENFHADWAKLVTAPLGRLDTPKLNTERTPDGWTAVTGAANATRQGASFAVILVTATGFGRTMSIVANVAGQERVAQVTQFFAQLDLHAAAAGNAAPAIGTGGLSGLYYSVQAGISSGARVEIKTRYFLPGNRITRTFPFGGGDTFDASRCNPDMCGSYTLEPGYLTIRWDNGRVDRLPFASSAEGIKLDGTMFKPARPMAETALAGVWTEGGNTGSSSANTYRFERNGAFTFGAGQGGVGGRYRVQGLTLMLKFTDGTERRRTLFATGTDEPARLITVDGDMYLRR